MSALFSRIRKLSRRNVRREASGSLYTNNVWNRWHKAMHFVFYGLLTFGLLSSLTDGPVDAPYSGGYVAGATGMALLLGGWYWLLVRTPRECVEARPLRTLGYFVVALGLFSGLVSVHPGFMSVAFVFYWHTFSLLPTRWAILGTAVLSLLLIWLSGGFEALTQMASTAGIAIFLGSLTVAAVLSLFIDSIIRQSEERQRLIEELEATRKELANEERRAGILEERGRLAREIHDTLAQGFISIVTHLEVTEEELPPGSKSAQRHLDRARSTARENLVEARRLVAALRPEILEGSSLPEALERLAERWSEDSGVPASLTVTGDCERLSQEVQVALLRVAQEALSNVRKHAGASAATITLSYTEDLVVLDVQDNGAGFDPDATPNGAEGGFGLQAIRERVGQFGGRLTVESAPGEGTTLAVQLPLETGDGSPRAPKVSP